jgi:hypothetical protein
MLAQLRTIKVVHGFDGDGKPSLTQVSESFNLRLLYEVEDANRGLAL